MKFKFFGILILSSMAVFGANETTPNLKEMTQNLWNQKAPKYSTMQCDGDALRFKCTIPNSPIFDDMFKYTIDDDGNKNYAISLKDIQTSLKASSNQIKVESKAFIIFGNQVLQEFSQDERGILPYKIIDELKITKNKDITTIQEESSIYSKDDSNMKIEYEAELSYAPSKDKDLLQLSAILYQQIMKDLIFEDRIDEIEYDITSDGDVIEDYETEEIVETNKAFEENIDQIQKELKINLKSIKITLDSKTFKNIFYQKYTKDSRVANIQQYESNIGFSIQTGLAMIFAPMTPLPENLAKALLEIPKSSVAFLSPDNRQSKIGIEIKSKNPPSFTLLEFNQMYRKQFLDLVSKYEIKILP